MEGYALTALASIVITGVGAWLVLGRNAVSRREYAELCQVNQAPIKKDIVYLREGQERVEKKVDKVGDKVDSALVMLHKMNGD